MANPIVQNLSNWFNTTIQNKSKTPSAPGNASNNTIAAAETTTQQTTPAPSTPQTPSTTTPTKKKDNSSNWRNSSAGVAISLGTATVEQKAEAYNQGASAQNVGLQKTNVAKGLDSKAGLYDVGFNIESSQTVTQTRPTNYVSIQQQQDFYDATGGLKLEGGMDARQTIEAQTDKAIKGDPIVGNIYSTAQTLLSDPVGRPNLTNNLFEQFEAYDKYDGSGDQRKTAAALAAIEIPSYIVGGGAAGVGTRAVQQGLTKLSSTKIGGAVVKAATTPISKNIPVSPATLTANSISGIYLGDTAVRILSQPTAEEKISTAGNILLKEIPAGAFGAIGGYKATAKFVNGLNTFGKTEIPAEKIKAPGIPLGNFNEAQLKNSFEKNILSPQPYKFARADNDIGKDTASTVSAKLNNLDDAVELYHVTAGGQNFKKGFTVRDSESEFGGLFAAPKAVEYFFYGSTDDIKVTPSFFIREFSPAESPAILNIKSRGVKPVDWQKAAGSVGRSVRQVKRDPELRKTAVDNFLISSESKNPGFAYMPMIKNEYEAVIPQGTEFKRLPIRYFTRIKNTRVPIYEYERVGFTPTSTNAKSTRGSSSSTSSYGRTSSRNYVSLGTPASLYPGSRSSTRTTSRDYNLNSRLNESLNKFNSPARTPASSTSAFNNAVLGSTGGTTANKTGLYNNITQQKATPQKINPIKSNYLFRKSNQIIKREKKRADDRKETEKIYSAVRTGRIDHLSIKDPLEFYGTGKSITDRTRPDRVLRKQALYFVDNAISTKRPTGRRKI